MTADRIAIDIFLAVAVAACWLGAVGMWRMKRPIQALHYLAFPAAVGVVALVIAVALQTGASETTAKSVAIAVILIAVNSVVAHATARALRMREMGHWEPEPEDPVEFLGRKPKS